jgi:hypothetical protein
MDSGVIASAETISHGRRTHARTKRAWVLTVLGAIAAILTLEFIFSFLVSGWHYPKTPIREIRQYTEGISVSHFVPDGFGTYGNRLTGNPVLPNVPTVLILGDSHVVQEAVTDRQTVGAVIENLSRRHSNPVNVRQYGWYDAAAPTYIANAPELLRAWHAQTVVVLLNLTDFTREALDEGWYWVMKIHKDFLIELIDVRIPEAHGRMAQIRDLVGRSHLMLALRRRSVLLFPDASQASARPAGPDPREAEIPLIARASIKGLKAAYGERLMVGYLPFCTETCPPEPDPNETMMFSACEAEGVHCFSTRPAMHAYMETYHRILRGFHNTRPGADHLNADGLEVAGTVIWQQMSKRLQ